jgi:nitroreductase
MLKSRPNADKTKSFYYDAPVVIILSGREDFYWSAVDAGIAVENMSIAAEALGLGSIIIGCIRDAMNGERRAYFSEELKLPEGYRYQIAFAAGRKAAGKLPHEFDEEKNVTYL